MKLLTVTILLSTLVAAAQNNPNPAPGPARPGLLLSTPAFEDGAIIPNQYTMNATSTPVSPQLQWTNVPDHTASFALIVHDPNTALQKKTEEVLHWMIFNIPGTARDLPQGVPPAAQLPDGSIQAKNTRQAVGYLGMGASAAGPYHHYIFELFALDTKLNLGPDATRTDVLNAMEGHVLGKGVVVGRFHR